jgi:hypothetical protein
MMEVHEMSCCPEYEELLFLDTYGELDPDSRSRWNAHLASCPACKEDSLRLLRLVARVKETLTPPPLPLAASQAWIRSARESLLAESPTWSWRIRQWFSGPWRSSTALATVCVFFALVSLLSFGPFQGISHRHGTSGQDPLQGLRSEEEEIINHLDLLSQMDNLQRLVQTLDEPNGDIPVPEPASHARESS